MESSKRRIALVVALVVAVAVLVAGGAVLGLGPFGGNGGVTDGDGGDGDAMDGDGDVTATPPPTGTVYTQPAEDGDQTQQPPFSFSIDRIEKCGQTCRDVTVTLYNNQNTTATNVTVFTQIYAGNSTSQDDKVWEGKEVVGTMEPTSNVTRTQRVELSTSEAFKVQQNDGWITIVTTISSDETTITFKQRRDVA